MPKITEQLMQPFTAEQVKIILEATAKYPNKQNDVGLRALVLPLRHSGLPLGDAVTLSRDRIENDTLILRTEKTGTLVLCRCRLRSWARSPHAPDATHSGQVTEKENQQSRTGNES